jgi:hypothetical protein
MSNAPTLLTIPPSATPVQLAKVSILRDTHSVTFQAETDGVSIDTYLAVACVCTLEGNSQGCNKCDNNPVNETERHMPDTLENRAEVRRMVEACHGGGL